MPKVQFVKARKDYPQFGIQRGQMHYVWSMKLQRGGVVRRALAKPRQSQLTMSEYKSAAFAIMEALEDAIRDAAGVDDLKSAAEEAAGEAESLRDEQQEKLDNMPEGLQQGDTGQMIQERIDALESFADELNSFDPEDFDPEDHEPEDREDAEEEHFEAAKSELENIQLEVN